MSAMRSAMRRCRWLHAALYWDAASSTAPTTTAPDQVHAYGLGTKSVPGVASRLALPSVAGLADTYALLPPELQDFYADPANFMLPRDEWPDSAPRSSYHGFTPEEWRKVVVRMVEAGMVRLSTTAPEWVNGVFAVEKNADEDRVILNAAPFNLRCRRPGDPHLPSPTDLGEIMAEPGNRLFAASLDTSNMFFTLGLKGKLEYISDYLAMPEVDGAHFGFPAGTPVWPHLLVAPMGWTHSVKIAQPVHERTVKRGLATGWGDGPTTEECGHVDFSPVASEDKGRRASSASTRRSNLPDDELDSILRTYVTTMAGPPPFRVSRDRLLRLGYIDDEGLASASLRLAQWGVQVVDDALADAGMPTKPSKRVLPDKGRFLTVLLGIALTLDARLMPSPETVRKLEGQTRYLLRQHGVSPRQVGSVLGRWIWVMLLNRPLLSVFDEVFSFVRTASAKRRRMPGPVRLELQAALALLPGLVFDLTTPYSSVCVASDASDWGGGGVYAPLETNTAEMLHGYSVRKGWNDQVDVPPEDLLPHEDLRCPPSLTAFVQTSTWKCAIRHKWRWKDHITLQEGRAHLLQLQWLARQPRLHRCRQPFLIDNQALVGALAKGRSSSRRLNRICRKSAGLYLFASVRPLVVWVPTTVQPADGPSRNPVSSK